MRIFSKTHDYYDGVVGHDSDTKRVFNRPEPEYIPNDKLKCENYIRHEYLAEFFIVGFCGEIYPAFRYKVRNNFYDYDHKTVYDYDSLPEGVMETRHKNTDIYFETNFSSKYFKHWFKKEYERWDGVKDFSHDFDYVFKEYHVPYFKVYRHGIELHPSLKELEFYKVFDAYSCYQRIDSYLFNELVPPDVINYEPSDKLKVQSHGFDKFSFRREKQKI